MRSFPEYFHFSPRPPADTLSFFFLSCWEFSFLWSYLCTLKPKACLSRRCKRGWGSLELITQGDLVPRPRVVRLHAYRKKAGGNGGGGIRTPETLSSLTVFKTAGFNRSPTPPSVYSTREQAVTELDAPRRLHSASIYVRSIRPARLNRRLQSLHRVDRISVQALDVSRPGRLHAAVPEDYLHRLIILSFTPSRCRFVARPRRN